MATAPPKLKLYDFSGRDRHRRWESFAQAEEVAKRSRLPRYLDRVDAATRGD